MISFFKKPIVAILIPISLGLIIFAFLNKNSKKTYNIINAKRQDIMEQVSDTGKVVPSESVDLAFEIGRKLF